MLLRILVAIDPAGEGKRIAALLDEMPDVIVSTPGEGEVIWGRLAADSFDVIVVGRSVLPAPEHDSVESMRNLPEHPELVVAFDGEDEEARARFLAAGCAAVLNTALADRFLAEQMAALVARTRERALEQLEREEPRKRRRLADFVTSSPAMRRLMALARQVAGVDTSILLLGETGVGKEWLARAVHDEGHRSGGPFIAVNCGAIPDTLMESELFGHREGAFTDAKKGRRGYFELAHRGTIFLDEIADLPVNVQVKLLRVLQEKRVRRLGGESEIEVDVRVMAATNRDLEEEVRLGRFRPDLYYRLAVVALTVPPLRERREDIPDLVTNYLGLYRTALGRAITGISPEAMEALVDYHWPGNVRELINVTERAVLLSTGETVRPADLPDSIVRGEGRGSRRGAPGGRRSAPPDGEGVERWLDKPLRAAKRAVVESFEREYLSAQLKRSAGRVGETARKAGIAPRSLFDKMKRHGLRKEDYKSSRGR